MTEVIKEVLPGHPAAALTGPNIAREIMAGQAAASVIATEDLRSPARSSGAAAAGCSASTPTTTSSAASSAVR